MAEANAKEGALASHGKRRKRKKEGEKIIIGRKGRISGVKFITMLTIFGSTMSIISNGSAVTVIDF